VTDYRDVNLANWNDRAAAHAASPDYAVSRYADDPAYLSHVVRFDRPLLGSIEGQRGIHLQCHIGTDTVSLARLGATMTGLDFSDKSLDEARRIAAAAGADITYLQSDVYEARSVAGDGYDFVYTGVGALCWLPDVARWARVVASLLRPGGRLFIREGHPVLWSLNEDHKDRLSIEYPYFETPEAMIFDYDGSYVQTEKPFTHNTTHSWNHGLAEIVTAVMSAGLTLTGLVEHRSVPWEALPGQMNKGDDDEWRLTDHPERLPLTYTLQAVRSPV
jgi:2-polyprenyl-3-methyl-5-hydroxy-6-metoxy-1,4-benzoquinol methylase